MILIPLLAAGFAAYAPPTNQDAFGAFTARILVDIREAGEVLREPEISMAPHFPSDVMLERCAPRKEWAVRMDNGNVIRYSGYECIIEVWPNAEPSYRTTGFFRHNGFEWEYYGAIQPVRIPSPEEFDPNKNDGRQLAKPGSLPYDGSPNNPFNEGYDPYAKFFEKFNRGQDSIY